MEREYAIPHSARLLVEDGQAIRAGQPMTEGSMNPKEFLEIMGVDAVQRFLVYEVQKVYRWQGVSINDKHVEIIVRQMLRKVTVDRPGDTELLPSELIDRFEFEETNNRILAEGGEPATAQTVLLGVTKASLNTNSFLAAASFQETTRVLTEAAIQGAKDNLIGLKENVIIGKLIPAGTGALEPRAKAASAGPPSRRSRRGARREAARPFLSRRRRHREPTAGLEPDEAKLPPRRPREVDLPDGCRTTARRSRRSSSSTPSGRASNEGEEVDPQEPEASARVRRPCDGHRSRLAVRPRSVERPSAVRPGRRPMNRVRRRPRWPDTSEGPGQRPFP